MKVSGAGAGTSAGGARRTGKVTDKGTTGQFKQALVDAMDALEEAHAVETSSAIGGVDVLLAVQGMGDATERESRRQMVHRGEDILDRLEEIRHGLLVGSVPRDKLEKLAQLVRNKRGNCGDPRLAGLLDEIELRAEVELAKLSRAP